MSPSIYRQFWRYAIPTVVAMLVNGLYQVIDGIFIGHYVGSNGLAAINVAWPLIGTIYGMGLLIGVGTGALVSIKQGEGQLLQAKRTLASGLLLLVLLSPLIAGGLYFIAEPFLLWQGAQDQVLELARQYLDVLLFSSLFTLGSLALPFLLRNDNSPNLATALMVIGALANIGLDYLFIAHLGWALKGAAIATALAQAIIALFGVLYFWSNKANMRLTFKDLKLNWAEIPQIFTIGASSFFMYAYGSLVVALHNSLFAEYGSLILIGAYAILGYLFACYYFVVEGLANGMQPLASYNHGAGNIENVRKLLMIAMGSAIFGGIAFVLLLNLFPQTFISLFNNDDPELMRNAILGIRLHLFALFLDGFLVIAAAYYQSINQGGKAMLVTIGNMLVQLPFLFVMPKIMGIAGVWLAYPLSNIALSVVVIGMLWRDLTCPPHTNKRALPSTTISKS